jgi:hypothetical protein
VGLFIHRLDTLSQVHLTAVTGDSMIPVLAFEPNASPKVLEISRNSPLTERQKRLRFSLPPEMNRGGTVELGPYQSVRVEVLEGHSSSGTQTLRLTVPGRGNRVSVYEGGPGSVDLQFYGANSIHDLETARIRAAREGFFFFLIVCGSLGLLQFMGGPGETRT